MNIVNGWLYYETVSDREHVYRICLDSPDKQEVSAEMLQQEMETIKKG
jgi:hypothetical protein